MVFSERARDMTTRRFSNFGALRRHWRHAALVGAVISGLALCYALLAAPVYESRTKILVLGSSQVQRAKQNVFGEEAHSSPQEQVTTQVQIARSPLLAARVVDQIGTQEVLDQMRWRWDWLVELPKQIARQALSYSGGWVLARLGWLKSPAELAQEQHTKAVKKIYDGLLIESVAKSEVFVLGFRAPSPEFAARVTNDMAREFIAHSVNLKGPRNTAEIADKAAGRLLDEVKQADAALMDFREQHDLFSIDAQQKQMLERREALQLAGAETLRRQQELSRRLEAIRVQVADLPAQGAVSRESRPNPALDGLRQRRAQLQGDLAQYTTGSRAAARLRAQIRQIDTQIESLAGVVQGDSITGRSVLLDQLQSTLILETAELEALNVRAGLLQEELAEVDQELKRLDSLEMQHLNLSRAARLKEEAYQLAQLQREEAALMSQLSEASLARVAQVERALVVRKPASPPRALIALLGGLAGLIGAAATVLGLEFRRRTMATAEECEFALGLRCVGQFPKAADAEANAPEFRRLGSWVMTHFRGQSGVALALASAHANPAQSGLITALAQTLRRQQAQVQVLRVVPGDHGTVAEAAEGVETVQAPPWEIAEALRAALQRARKEANYVLIDLPEPQGFPEYGQLLTELPAMMLIVEAEQTRVPDAELALSQFTQAKTELCGVIFNNQTEAATSRAFCEMSMRRRRRLAQLASV